MSPEHCLLKPDPALQQIHFPHSGFTSLNRDDLGIECSDMPVMSGIRKSAGLYDLFLSADGPSGSGHYWNVAIGIAAKSASKATRGICIAASTIGFRTLRQYKNLPLEWLEDIDKDGKSEVVLWDNFPINQETVEYGDAGGWGLMAWVYRLSSEGILVIDWELSRRIDLEIAKAYRLPLNSDQHLTALRKKAAEALEVFGNGLCVVP
jgi:hypothetical protein